MFEARGLVLVLLNMAAFSDEMDLPIEEIIRKQMLKKPPEAETTTPGYRHDTKPAQYYGAKPANYDRKHHRHFNHS